MRLNSFEVLQPAVDQLNENIRFREDYENYVDVKCGGVASADCAEAHYEAWENVNDKLEVVDKAKLVLSVVVGGGMAAGPKMLQVLKNCAANLACLNELGITLVEAGAEVAAGGPLAGSGGIAFATGSVVLKKGDEVLGVIDETLGHLTHLNASSELFRASDGSLLRFTDDGEWRVLWTEQASKKTGLTEDFVDQMVSTPKGERPDPSTYMSQTEIDAHLTQFEGGVTKIKASAPSGIEGPPGGTFVMPKAEADRLIAEAGGDVRQLEKLLGLKSGDLGASPVRVDIDNPSGLRMPSGNEIGANSMWVPGGRTAGGIWEATINPVPASQYQVTSIYE